MAKAVIDQLFLHVLNALTKYLKIVTFVIKVMIMLIINDSLSTTV